MLSMQELPLAPFYALASHLHVRAHGQHGHAHAHTHAHTHAHVHAHVHLYAVASTGLARGRLTHLAWPMQWSVEAVQYGVSLRMLLACLGDS